MGTKTRCDGEQETFEDFRDFPSFVLCEVKTTNPGRVHIGFFTSNRKEFVILCGAFDNEITFNPTSAYDISTLKRIKEPFTITFN